ncbi:uncharacterized protein [Diadema setosum]|uniref:uncharacterized protein n=1 Tax=Diadema setosum TaxID=31175 RepID=UPI003B3B1FD1
MASTPGNMSRPNSPSTDEETLEELSKEDRCPSTSAGYRSWSDDDTLEGRSTNRMVRDRSKLTNIYCSNRLTTLSSRSINQAEEMLDELLGDVNAMMDSAKSIVEAAQKIRNLVHQSLESVDLCCSNVSKLGLVATIKDLRQETVRAVVDADRANLRFEKVASEFTQLRRCLRRLGVIPTGPTSYGVQYTSGRHGSGALYSDTIDEEIKPKLLP